MKPDTEITTRRLDLAARGIDLLGSLINIASSKNSLTGIAMEVGAWLGRERLDRHELQTCFEHSRGLLRPNDQGEVFLRDVKTGVSTHAVLPLQVQPSGALGRLLLDDPLLCWLISTATCLLQHHDEADATDTLLTLILNTSLAREHEYLHPYRLSHDPLRFQLKTVVHRLVSSVWLNVVNAREHELAPKFVIPGLCSYGHRLQSTDFGLFMSAIRQDYKKMMVQSELVPTDLLLWLRYHFHGRIRVVLCGKIVHDEILGQNGREIELRIGVACPTDGSCRSKPQFQTTVKFYTDLAGSYKEFLRGEIETKHRDKTERCARSALYTTRAPYPLEGQMGRDTLKMQVRCTAQAIVRWMLAHTIEPSYSDHLAFPVLRGDEEEVSTGIGIVADLLARQPSMLNRKWGEVLSRTVVFADAVDDADVLPDAYEDDGREFSAGDADDQYEQGEVDPVMENKLANEPSLDRPEDILRYFPCLRDLMDAAAAACQCMYCRPRHHSQPERVLRPGCYQWNAFTDVMALIAHAIADGFGAPDVSTTASLDFDQYGTAQLLMRLCHNREVVWEQWMRVAAKVYLGYPDSAEISYDPTTKSFETTTIAIQFGSLAVVAPWLDLTRSIEISGCFAFQQIQGRLCVQVDAGAEPRFQIVEDEFAVIKTQIMEDFTPHDNEVDMKSLPIGQEWGPALDQDSIETDVMLVSADRNTFTLLQRVRSRTFSRLINPSRTMLKVAQVPVQCACPHNTDAAFTVADLSHAGASYSIAPCSFDQILGTWLPSDTKIRRSFPTTSDAPTTADTPTMTDAPTTTSAPKRSKVKPPKLALGREPARTAKVFISSYLDSYSKFNIALALAPDEGVAISASNACVECSIGQAVRMAIHNRFDGVVTRPVPINRWVVNTTKILKESLIHYSSPQASSWRRAIK